MSDSNEDVVRIETVIIGAGASGIAAALHLLDNQHTDFVILEAGNRIGGRIHTIDFENDIIEYGAQYIHGQEGNPIFEFAKEHKLIDEADYEIDESWTDPLNTNFWREHDGDQLFLTKSGELVSGDLSFRFNTLIDQWIKNVPEYVEANRSQISTNTSLGDYLLEKFEAEIKLDEFKEATETDMEQVRGIFAWRVKFESLYSGSDSVFDQSLLNYGNYKELRGNKAVQFSHGGYKLLFESIINAKHGEEFYARVKLNHKLKRIDVCAKLVDQNPCSHCEFTNDSNLVLVTTDTNKRFLCKRVLCTISLGCLKAHVKDLIQPNSIIPAEKLESIQNIGFGTVNKIHLCYDKPWWDEGLEAIQPIATFKNINEFTDSIKNPFRNDDNFSESDNWLESICEFGPSHTNPNVIIVWLSGSWLHEQLSDAQVAEGCTRMLRQLLGRSDVPEPTRVLQSKWHSEPLFNGAYSYISLSTRRNDNSNFAEPIRVNNKDLILFAGEATHPDYFSTVHGAYLSGIREATRILSQP